MITPRSRRLASAGLVACALVLAACGGSGDDDQEPDEANFCRLALLNEPVAETSAAVLDRLEQLATDEIDPAVVVLRDAAVEMEAASPGTPEAVALEFEVRFRPEYIAARRAVEDYVATECDPAEILGRTTTTTTPSDTEPDTDTDTKRAPDADGESPRDR
ncbi:MAG: hypothetical protein ACXIVQ_11875 [Acidimicrobiales bacterium]